MLGDKGDVKEDTEADDEGDGAVEDRPFVDIFHAQPISEVV